MGKYHADDITKYFKDAFGFYGTIDDSSDRLTKLFESLDVKMAFDGCPTKEQVSAIPCETELSDEDVFSLIISITRGE